MASMRGKLVAGNWKMWQSSENRFCCALYEGQTRLSDGTAGSVRSFPFLAQAQSVHRQPHRLERKRQ